MFKGVGLMGRACNFFGEYLSKIIFCNFVYAYILINKRDIIVLAKIRVKQFVFKQDKTYTQRYELVAA